MLPIPKTPMFNNTSQLPNSYRIHVISLVCHKIPSPHCKAKREKF